MRDKGSGVLANWNCITICLVFAVTITLLIMYCPAMREIDTVILKSIRKFLHQFPAYIPAFVTDIGREWRLFWPQLAACSALLSNQKYIKAFLLVFFAQASYLFVGFLKDFVCRERPCIHPGYSYPSGHAVTTMCLYGIIIYLIMKYTRSTFWRYTLSVFFGVFIFLVALSRLWLGVHFLTDVTAGLLWGLIFVNLFIITSKFFEN